MIRPLDDRALTTADAAEWALDNCSELLAGVEVYEADLRAAIDTLRECAAALQTAREDGAGEERDRIVAWIEADCPELVYGPQESIMPDIVAGIASGKHRS